MTEKSRIVNALIFTNVKVKYQKTLDSHNCTYIFQKLGKQVPQKHPHPLISMSAMAQIIEKNRTVVYYLFQSLQVFNFSFREFIKFNRVSKLSKEKEELFYINDCLTISRYVKRNRKGQKLQFLN